MASSRFVDVDIEQLARRQRGVVPQASVTAAAAVSSGVVTEGASPGQQAPHDLSVDARDLKDRGNRLFAAKRYAEAVEAYTAAAAALAGDDDLTDTIRALLATCHANAALAELSRGRPAAAATCAAAAKKVDPLHGKACFRHGAALLALASARSDAGDSEAGVGSGAVHVDALVAAARSCRDAAAAASSTKRMARQLMEQAAALETAAGQQCAAVDAASNTTVTCNDVPLQPVGRQPRRKPAVTAAVLPPSLAAAGFEYTASPDGVDTNLLVLLHGLGDSALGFAALGKALRLPQTAVLALSGPVAMPLGLEGRSWYECYRADGSDVAPAEAARSVSAAADAVATALHALHKTCGWPYHAVHVLGLAQGASIALAVACRATVGSVVAVGAGAVPGCEPPSAAASEASCSASGHSAGAGAGAGAGADTASSTNDWMGGAGAPVLLLQAAGAPANSETNDLLEKARGLGKITTLSVPGQQLRLASQAEVDILLKHFASVLTMRMVHLEDSPDVIQVS